MLTSTLLKSQRDSVKGKEMSLLEAGREMRFAGGWLAVLSMYGDSFSFYPQNFSQVQRIPTTAWRHGYLYRF